MTTKDVVRIAAVGDVHYGKGSQGSIQALFPRLNDEADVLVLCGDLTDYGLAEEAELLARDLTAAVKIPMVGVLGNHDFESGQQDRIKEVLTRAGVIMLDGDACEIHGVGFAGVKGFAGGFGRGVLGAWGEPMVKQFVNEAVQEALKLESALARLRMARKMAVLHYAPIRTTIEGEPPEIFPYLGTSRLEEPIGRYQVSAVVHGHAHAGSPEGTTTSGVPVYNVSLPLMKKRTPETLYRIITLTEPVQDAAPQYRRRATDAPLTPTQA